jgi:Cytochrome c oxidase subunit Vb
MNAGTLNNPIVVKSFGDEQYAGCTGYPADSHVTIWLTVCSLLIQVMEIRSFADVYGLDVS